MSRSLISDSSEITRLYCCIWCLLVQRSVLVWNKLSQVGEWPDQIWAMHIIWTKLTRFININMFPLDNSVNFTEANSVSETSNLMCKTNIIGIVVGCLKFTTQKIILTRLCITITIVYNKVDCWFSIFWAINLIRSLSFQVHFPQVGYVWSSSRHVNRSLNADTLRKYTTKSDQIYSCNFCSYTTGNATNMINHLRMHLNIKPFKCKLCDYASTTKQAVTLHMANRHKL